MKKDGLSNFRYNFLSLEERVVYGGEKDIEKVAHHNIEKDVLEDIIQEQDGRFAREIAELRKNAESEGFDIFVKNQAETTQKSIEGVCKEITNKTNEIMEKQGLTKETVGEAAYFFIFDKLKFSLRNSGKDERETTAKKYCEIKTAFDNALGNTIRGEKPDSPTYSIVLKNVLEKISAGAEQNTVFNNAKEKMGFYKEVQQRIDAKCDLLGGRSYEEVFIRALGKKETSIGWIETIEQAARNINEIKQTLNTGGLSKERLGQELFVELVNRGFAVKDKTDFLKKTEEKIREIENFLQERHFYKEFDENLYKETVHQLYKTNDENSRIAIAENALHSEGFPLAQLETGLREKGFEKNRLHPEVYGELLKKLHYDKNRDLVAEKNALQEIDRLLEEKGVKNNVESKSETMKMLYYAQIQGGYGEYIDYTIHKEQMKQYMSDNGIGPEVLQEKFDTVLDEILLSNNKQAADIVYRELIKQFMSNCKLGPEVLQENFDAVLQEILRAEKDDINQIVSRETYKEQMKEHMSQQGLSRDILKERFDSVLNEIVNTNNNDVVEIIVREKKILENTRLKNISEKDFSDIENLRINAKASELVDKKINAILLQKYSQDQINQLLLEECPQKLVNFILVQMCSQDEINQFLLQKYSQDEINQFLPQKSSQNEIEKLYLEMHSKQKIEEFLLKKYSEEETKKFLLEKCSQEGISVDVGKKRLLDKNVHNYQWLHNKAEQMLRFEKVISQYENDEERKAMLTKEKEKIEKEIDEHIQYGEKKTDAVFEENEKTEGNDLTPQKAVNIQRGDSTNEFDAKLINKNQKNESGENAEREQVNGKIEKNTVESPGENSQEQSIGEILKQVNEIPPGSISEINKSEGLDEQSEKDSEIDEGDDSEEILEKEIKDFQSGQKKFLKGQIENMLLKNWSEEDSEEEQSDKESQNEVDHSSDKPLQWDFLNDIDEEQESNSDSDEEVDDELFSGLMNNLLMNNLLEEKHGEQPSFEWSDLSSDISSINYQSSYSDLEEWGNEEMVLQFNDYWDDSFLSELSTYDCLDSFIEEWDLSQFSSFDCFTFTEEASNFMTLSSFDSFSEENQKWDCDQFSLLDYLNDESREYSVDDFYFNTTNATEMVLNSTERKYKKATLPIDHDFFIADFPLNSKRKFQL